MVVAPEASMPEEIVCRRDDSYVAAAGRADGKGMRLSDHGGPLDCRPAALLPARGGTPRCRPPLKPRIRCLVDQSGTMLASIARAGVWLLLTRGMGSSARNSTEFVIPVFGLTLVVLASVVATAYDIAALLYTLR